MRKIYSLILALLLVSAVLHSQTIKLELTQQAGKPSVVTFKNGIQKDTIYNGILDEKGMATIHIPKNLVDYKGMATLNVNNQELLDFIINHENMSILCNEEYPQSYNVTFSNSIENETLQTKFKEQAIRQKKLTLLTEAEKYYTSKDVFYQSLNNEKETLETEQSRFEQNLKESKLYADKFISFYNFLNKEVTNLIYADSTQMAFTRKYVLENLNIEQLYTSGLWFETINGILIIYDNGAPFHKLFINDLSKLLKDVKSDRIYKAIANNLFAICESMGWNDQEEQLAYFLINDGRIKQPDGKLKMLLSLFKLSKGDKAPNLTQMEMPKGKTLLSFYESGCGNCDIQMYNLKQNYDYLILSGVNIISVSSDINEQIFRNTAAQFPWTDKVCDLKGFEGQDFKNYGVIATPTFFVVDENQKIIGRYARLEDTGLIK